MKSITFSRLQEIAQDINHFHALDTRREISVLYREYSGPKNGPRLYQLVAGSGVPLSEWITGKVMIGFLSGVQVGLGIKTRTIMS